MFIFYKNVNILGNLNTEAANWILGYINGVATPPTFTDLGGHVKNVIVARASDNAYTISWGTPHPKSSNYAINLTGVVNQTPRVRSYPGSDTSIQVVIVTGTNSFQTGYFMITIFK